jgi:AcrR family transcriptional regulator
MPGALVDVGWVGTIRSCARHAMPVWRAAGRQDGGGAVAARGPYRKGARKRREILLAAIDVFSRRGYRNASIREIADTVGLTQAGLLHYFPSKDDLFAEVVRVRDELDEATSADIVEALRIAIEHNAQVEGLVHLFVTVSAEAIDEAHPGHGYFQDRYSHLIGLLADRVLAGQREGTITDAVSPEMAARLCLAVVDGLQIQWLLDPDSVDMVAAFDAFWQMLVVTENASR